MRLLTIGDIAAIEDDARYGCFAQFVDSCFEHAIGAIASPMTELHHDVSEESANDIVESGIELPLFVVVDEIEKDLPHQFFLAIAEQAPCSQALRNNQTTGADHHDQIGTAVQNGLEPLFILPQAFLR